MAVILLLTAFSYGQTATATLSGLVSDESGAVIAGAAVTARNTNTGVTRNFRTDDQGRYNVVNLEPGSYELRVELSGFKTAVRSNVVLTVGGAASINITMSVGNVTETVVVETGEQLIEPTRAEVSRVSESRQIETLPPIGRTVVDFG